MKVTPFETYQSYLSMKSHFTNRKYDFLGMVVNLVQLCHPLTKEKISIGSKNIEKIF